jgi:glycosyltransferase involved in cell wall biosynthesis
MRRILIIAYAFPPFPASGSARPWRFYKYLPEFGYEAYTLTASRPEKELPRVEFVAPPEGSFGERFCRKFLFPNDEGVLWTRSAIAAGIRLIAEKPMDAVLSTIPPVHGHTVAYFLKKRFGLRWIADYRDPIVDNPLRAYRGLPKLLDRIMENRVCTAADRILTVTDHLRDEWIQRHPETAQKVAVLWNGFDPSEEIEAKAIPPKAFRVLAHIGSFYAGRTPVMPLSSVDRLIQRSLLDPKCLRVRLIGSLDAKIRRSNQELFDRLTHLGVLECMPYVPRAEALKSMMEVDQLMLADNNPSNIGHTVPAKLFEYIRVGRPILALTSADSPVERILTISGVPFVALYPNLREETIDARLLDFLRLSSDPVRPSRRFCQEFDGRNQAQTLALLLDQLLDGSQSDVPALSAS